MTTAYELTKSVYALDTPADQPAKTDDAAMSARFLLTNSEVDRDGDVVVTTGLDWSRHKAAPVVFFEHKRTLPYPIAVSETPGGVYTVEVQKDRAYGTAYFKSGVRESVQIFELVKSGLLRGASIGFILHDAQPRGKGRGQVIKSGEITEWSVVGVPANSHALRAELTKSLLAGSPVSDELKQALEPYTAEKGKAWANGYVIGTDEPEGSPVSATTKAAPAADQPAEGELLIGVLCPRTAFGGREDAIKWCEGKDYDTGQLSEEADGWHFEQPREAPVVLSTLRRVDLDGGATGFVAKAFQGKVPPPAPPSYSGQLKDAEGKVFTVVDGRISKVFEPLDDSDPEPEPGVDCTFRLRDGRMVTFVRGKMVSVDDPDPGDVGEPPALTPAQEQRIGSLERVLSNVLSKQDGMLRKLGGK